MDEPGEPGAACAATWDRAPTATPDLPAERQRAQGSRAAASVPAVTLGVTTALPAWGSGVSPWGSGVSPWGRGMSPWGTGMSPWGRGMCRGAGDTAAGPPHHGTSGGKGRRASPVLSVQLGAGSNQQRVHGLRHHRLVSSDREIRPWSCFSVGSARSAGVSIGECHTRGRLEGRAWCRPAAPGSLLWFEIWNNSWVLSWFFRALN